MGFSSAAATTVGAVTKAAGAYTDAKARKGALRAQAQIADEQGRQALAVGEHEEQNSDLRTGALFGQQRANLAANGVDLGSGSALDVLASTKFLGIKDAMTIHDNALRTAYTYRTQASLLNQSASNISPLLSAGTSLLGSAGTVGKSWYDWNKGGGQLPSFSGG